MKEHAIGTPWLITEQGLRRVLQLVAAHGTVMQAPGSAPQTDSGVATVPIMGPLVARGSWLTELLGFSDYGTIRKNFDAAMADPAVSSVILHVDSPGGEASGVNELAEAIYQARGKKPITAYVAGSGASAAYWLASAADKIIADKTAELGSIGVRAAILDDSKALETAGLKEIHIVSSQSPNKRLDPSNDASMAALQERIDELAGVFIDTVARNRNVSVETVTEKFGKGGTLLGERAKKAGLADDLGSYEAVHASLSASKGARMSTTFQARATTAVKLSDGASDEQVITRIAKLQELETRLIAATGASDCDEAFGKVKAGVEALTEVAALKAERAKEQAAAIQTRVQTKISKAHSESKLTLAQLRGVVPAFLGGSDADAVTALAAEAETNFEASMAAVMTAQWTLSAEKALTAYLDAQGAIVPKAVKEPPPADGVVLSSDDLKICKQMNIKPEDMIASITKRRKAAQL